MSRNESLYAVTTIDSKCGNPSSHSETISVSKNLHSDRELETPKLSSNSNTQSSSDLSQNDQQTQKMAELEDMLDRLDSNLGKVLAQMESVKKTRDELFIHTRKLHQNLELSGGEPDLDNNKAKKLQLVMSEIKKREDVMKELEKREMLLSHLMLAIINSWAKELESNLNYEYNRVENNLPEINEIYAKTMKK